MSRVKILDRLYGNYKEKGALDFNYEALRAPNLFEIMHPDDCMRLQKIASSVKLAARVDEKYQMIDEIMERNYFRRRAAGTNRLVYNSLEIPFIVAKVAIDRVGIRDNPCEFTNQVFLKPHCCRVFESHPTGVIAIVEKVNHIASIEEFASVSDDIFNLITGKLLGKYVLDDIGVTRFLNYGIRPGFGPVLLDFPYVYELDGRKLVCMNPIISEFGNIRPCGGEIDYDAGFDNLRCEKCGKTYKARELATDSVKKIKYYKGGKKNMATQVSIYLGDQLIEKSVMSSEHLATEQEINLYYGKNNNTAPTQKNNKNYLKYQKLKALREAQNASSKATDVIILEDGKEIEHIYPDGINPDFQIKNTDDNTDDKPKRDSKGRFIKKNNSKSSTKKSKKKGEPVKKDADETPVAKEPPITQEDIDKANLFSGSDENDENKYADYIPPEEEDNKPLFDKSKYGWKANEDGSYSEVDDINQY